MTIVDSVRALGLQTAIFDDGNGTVLSVGLKVHDSTRFGDPLAAMDTLPPAVQTRFMDIVYGVGVARGLGESDEILELCDTEDGTYLCVIL